jgi:hypothetical protein
VAPVVAACSARSAKAQPGLPPRYLEACRLAEEGKYEDARRAYGKLKKSTSRSNARLRGLIRNDLAVLAAIAGSLTKRAPAGKRPWRSIPIACWRGSIAI